MLRLNNDPTPDTYDPQEAAALRRVVAQSVVADPLTAIQSAVTNALMLWDQNWTCEALDLMDEMGLAPQRQAAMHIA